MDLFFLATMKALGVKDDDTTKKELPLVGFNSNTAYTIGTMALSIMVTKSIIMTKFVVINVLTHYNAILRRPQIHKLKVVTH